jgi:hypothetical protein
MMAVPKVVLPRNGTAPTFLSNGTRTASNTTATGTSPAVPSKTEVVDTSCGETATPFAVKVVQPGGLFDGWFLKVSGNGLLFTSVESLATKFSVEGSGHLCPIGFAGQDGYPAISVVENLENRTDTPGSDVWLMDSKVLHDRGEPAYAPVSCAVGTGQLICIEDGLTQWVGCGLQLALANGAAVNVNGLNCSSVVLTTI